MTDSCDHLGLKNWLLGDLRFAHIVLEVSRCHECQQTLKPAIDEDGGDVYLRRFQTQKQ